MRFYTYVSTMLLCLEAAAEAGSSSWSSTAPTPWAGSGSRARCATPALPRSLVNMAPGPLVHGLTLGEIARYVTRRDARSRTSRPAVSL